LTAEASRGALGLPSHMLDTRNASGRRFEHVSPRLRSDVLDRYTSDRTQRSLFRFGSLASGSDRLQILYSGANAHFGSLSWTASLNCLASGHWPPRLLVATQNSGQHVKMPHAGFQSLEGWTLLLIFERKKKDHLAAVSPKSDQVFRSGGYDRGRR
jgi:hypothetical protein